MKKILFIYVVIFVFSNICFAGLSTVESVHEMIMTLSENAILSSGGKTEGLYENSGPDRKSISDALLIWMQRKTLQTYYLVLDGDDLIRPRVIELVFTYPPKNNHKDIMNTPDYRRFREEYKKLGRIKNCRWRVLVINSDTNKYGWVKTSMPSLNDLHKVSFQNVIINECIQVSGAIYYKMRVEV